MKKASWYSRDNASGEIKLRRARSVSRILMLVVLAATFVLLALAMFNYTRNTVGTIETQLRKKMELSVKQTRSNVDYRLEQTKESAWALIAMFYPYLNSEADVTEQMGEYDTIRHAMAEQIGKHMITSLQLYVPDEKIYSGQMTNEYALNRLSELEIEDSGYPKGGVFWEEAHLSGLGQTKPKLVVSCGVALTSQKNYEKLCGVLFADVELAQFQEIFASGSTEGDEMFLVDGRGRILVHQDDNRIGETALSLDQMEEIHGLSSGYLLGGDDILAFGKLSTSDWYIVASMPRIRGYTMDQGAVYTIVIMWVVACMILFIIAVTVAYNLNLDRAVSNINSAVRALEAEETPKTDTQCGNTQAGQNYDARQPVRQRKYNVTSLERDTEQIVRSIAGVVEARYRDRLAISEYQMEALQEQIKPHFLYNTLDVIKWMIMDKKQEESVWMVNALSKYLRLSISKGEPVVTLAEELELTRMYLGIMQKRFSNQFLVEYDLEDKTLECRLPRLSLQPLVENALLHGVLHCDKPERRLTIRTWRSLDIFGVEIEDNGNGMTEEMAKRLTDLKVQAGESYGVANVHRRLDIFAHGACAFLVSSQEGAGTCVAIELPIRVENDI